MMRSGRIPLQILLEKLPKPSARLWLALFARDVLQLIKTRKISIARAENILFNLDVLLFCDKKLKDRDLQWIVEYGMELADVEKIAGRYEVLKACQEIGKRIAKVTAAYKLSTDNKAATIV